MSRHQQRPEVEPFEPRQLLTTAVLDGDTLRVTGTEGADLIRITQQRNLFTIEGVQEKFDARAIHFVLVDGLGGNDTITLVRSGQVSFGATTLIDGGDGNDLIDVRRFQGRTASSITGGLGDDTIYGGDGNDLLAGDAGNDLIFGGNGADRIFGEDGNDRLVGGGGNDEITGGLGDDTLEGNAGNDNLFGEEGNDLLLGGNNNDKLDGGDGNDTLRGDGLNDLLLGGEGDDDLYGGSGNDTLDGGAGSNRIFPGPGRNRVIRNQEASLAQFDAATNQPTTLQAPSTRKLGLLRGRG